MRLIYLSFAATMLWSCKKSEYCEKWKTYDTCEPKNALTICTDPPVPNYTTYTLCGSKLRGVYAGATQVVYEDANAKKIRHYVEKVN